MLKYNLVTSFRSIGRNLSFSLIIISGLSLGLALVVISMAWLQFEFLNRMKGYCCNIVARIY